MNRRRLAQFVLAAATSGLAIWLHERTAFSSDHIDAPAAAADPPADIADLYSWVDGSNTVLAMTVFPEATTTSQFSNSVEYVFHTSSGAGFSGTRSADYVIMCTFDVSQVVQCWAAGDEYVKGNANTSTGLVSADGKFRVFAGPRADPFFFNLSGFKVAVSDVVDAGFTTFNGAGCPTVSGPQATVLANALSHDVGGGSAVDNYATFDALAIVVSIDTTLLTKSGAIVSMWGSTNTVP